jgi:hypothetical protein
MKEEGHRDLVYEGITNIRGGRGRPSKRGFRKAPEFVAIDTQRRYVEVPDPVTDFPMVITTDAARLFQSEFGHPVLAPELEKALLDHAFPDEVTFWDLPEEAQLDSVRAFLRVVMIHAENITN